MLARVAGAALIAITFISIAKTPFAPRAAAQNAAGYRVDSRSADGLYITTFTTPQGVIKVNLPDDMAAGDTISGSPAHRVVPSDTCMRAGLTRTRG